MAMPSETLPNNFPLSHFEGRKERCGAMALVIIGHGSTAAFFQRQSRLRAIQRLNLTLLVHAEYQGFVRRVQIQAHHIRQFLQKLGITRQLERLCSVWLKTMALPDPAYCCFADTLFFSHRATTPVGCPRRPTLKGGMDDLLNLICRKLRFPSTSCRHFPKTLWPFFKEALSPQRNRFWVNLHALGDILILSTFC